MTEHSDDLFGSISISGDKKPVDVPEERSEKAPEPPRQPKIRHKRSMSGSVKLLLIAILVLGLYTIAGFALVPYLAKNSLPDYLSDKLNIKLSISEAQFNPFDFNLILQGISAETNEMGEPQARFLSVSEIRIDLDLLSLLRGDLVCSSMDVDQLFAKITRDPNKRYNLSYLFKNNVRKNEAGIIDFAELPFLFSLNNIKISDSQIIFDDRSTKKEHRIEEIQLALPAISNFPYQSDSYIHPRFSAVVNGSPIKLSGEATLSGSSEDGRETQLSCDLDDIDIPLYFDYLPVSLPLDVNQGRANGKLQISFSPDEEQGSKLKIGFSLATSDLAFESRNSKLSLKIPSAKFEGSLEPFNESLTIQSILLREPTLTSDGTITRETLATLLPLTKRPTPDDPLHQVIPSIGVKLLIADGGSVIIKKSGDKKPVRIWHSLQLSVKNFTNDLLTPTELKNSFRLSGEHLSSSAFFTWQGQFDNENRPGGNLQLNSVDAAVIAPFLGREAKDVEGIADVSGLLSIALDPKSERPFDYTLKSTRVSVKNLKLKDKGVEWLSVPNLRCEPVSRINNITDLGNVFLKNSRVTLESTALPHLFDRFSKKPTQHVIHGIDFSGTIVVSNKRQKIDTIEFTETILQANRLEQQQVSEENFVFSATVNKSGSIKAKGILDIAPLQVSSEVAFSGLKPSDLVSWFTTSSYHRKSESVLAGQGRFRFPQKEFKGTIIAEALVLPELNAEKVRFDNLLWSASESRLSINYFLLEKPIFSWVRPEARVTNPLTPFSDFLRKMLVPKTTVLASDSSQNNDAFGLTINQIDIDNGTVTYLDKRVLPPLALRLTSINGNLSNLSAPRTIFFIKLALPGKEG